MLYHQRYLKPHQAGTKNTPSSEKEILPHSESVESMESAKSIESTEDKPKTSDT